MTHSTDDFAASVAAELTRAGRDPGPYPATARPVGGGGPVSAGVAAPGPENAAHAPSLAVSAWPFRSREELGAHINGILGRKPNDGYQVADDLLARFAPAAETADGIAHLIWNAYEWTSGRWWDQTPERDPGKQRARALATQLAARTQPPEIAEAVEDAHDAAVEWITKNLMAFRRDNGSMEYTLQQVIRAFRAGAALRSQPASRDSGEAMREVPVEPTERMIRDGGDAIEGGPGANDYNAGISEKAAERCWAAMLAAALLTSREGSAS